MNYGTTLTTGTGQKQTQECYILVFSNDKVFINDSSSVESRIQIAFFGRSRLRLQCHQFWGAQVQMSESGLGPS